MKLNYDDLPEEVKQAHPGGRVHKVVKKGRSTLVVYAAGKKETWKKSGQAWVLVGTADAETTVFVPPVKLLQKRPGANGTGHYGGG